MTSKERVLAVYPDVKATSLHSITGNVAYYVLLPGEPAGFFLVTRPTENAAWDAACDRIRAKMGLPGRSPDVDALVKAAEDVCQHRGYLGAKSFERATDALSVALSPFRPAKEKVKADPPVIELREIMPTKPANPSVYVASWRGRDGWTATAYRASDAVRMLAGDEGEVEVVYMGSAT